MVRTFVGHLCFLGPTGILGLSWGLLPRAIWASWGFGALESPRLNLQLKFGVWCFWTQMPLASAIWVSGAAFAS